MKQLKLHNRKQENGKNKYNTTISPANSFAT